MFGISNFAAKVQRFSGAPCPLLDGDGDIFDDIDTAGKVRVVNDQTDSGASPARFASLLTLFFSTPCV